MVVCLLSLCILTPLDKMALTVCDCSVINILPLISASKILGQTNRVQRLLFSVADHLYSILENEPEVYAMGLKS